MMGGCSGLAWGWEAADGTFSEESLHLDILGIHEKVCTITKNAYFRQKMICGNNKKMIQLFIINIEYIYCTYVNGYRLPEQTAAILKH